MWKLAIQRPPDTHCLAPELFAHSVQAWSEDRPLPEEIGSL